VLARRSRCLKPTSRDSTTAQLEEQHVFDCDADGATDVVSGKVAALDEALNLATRHLPPLSDLLNGQKSGFRLPDRCRWFHLPSPACEPIKARRVVMTDAPIGVGVESDHSSRCNERQSDR
jgi:hypothetical protein